MHFFLRYKQKRVFYKSAWQLGKKVKLIDLSKLKIPTEKFNNSRIFYQTVGELFISSSYPFRPLPPLFIKNCSVHEF